MVGTDGFFVELNEQEKLSKLNQLTGNQIHVWSSKSVDEQTVEQPSTLKIKTECMFAKGEATLLYLAQQIEQVNFAKKYLIRFELGDVIYLGSGIWQDRIGKDSSFPYSFKLGDHLYRYEKRAGDRLLTYPHRSVFLACPSSVEPNIGSNENIIQFDQKKQKLMRLYSELNDISLAKEIKLRVLDISPSGLAFFGGLKEVEYFLGNISNGIILEFNNKKLELKNIEVLYQVEYLDTFLKKTSLQKIGIKYSSENGLNDEIERLLGSDRQGRIDIQDDFEEFLLES